MAKRKEGAQVPEPSMESQSWVRCGNCGQPVNDGDLICPNCGDSL